jgi:hypothetical protein
MIHARLFLLWLSAAAYFDNTVLENVMARESHELIIRGGAQKQAAMAVSRLWLADDDALFSSFAFGHAGSSSPSPSFVLAVESIVRTTLAISRSIERP